MFANGLVICWILLLSWLYVKCVYCIHLELAVLVVLVCLISKTVFYLFFFLYNQAISKLKMPHVAQFGSSGETYLTF